MARLISLPVAGLGSLLPLQWIDAQRGVREFAFLSVIYALPLLFTLAELGYGGVASTAVGAQREHPRRAGPAVGAIATLYLIVAAVVGVLVIVGDVVADGPGRWLGYPELGIASTLALVVAALGVPASLGARVLIGLDRAVTVVALQSLPSVLSAVAVYLLLAVDAGPALLAVGLLSGGLLVNVPLTVVGLRAVRATPVRCRRLRDVLAGTGYPAWPNFASSVSAILLVQMPRLVLPHRAGDAAVAELGVALVFFVPAASLVFVSGQALWSDFSNANARHHLDRSRLLGALRYSVTIGVILAVGFATVGPVAARLVTPGVSASVSVYLALAVLLLVFAIDLPLNVAMLTGRGARQRGLLIVLQLVVALLASLLVPAPSAERLIWIQTVTLLIMVFLPSGWLQLRGGTPDRQIAGRR